MTKFLKFGLIAGVGYVLLSKSSAAPAATSSPTSTKLQPAPRISALDPLGNPIASVATMQDDPAIIRGAPLISPILDTPLPMNGHPGIFVLNAPTLPQAFPNPSFAVPAGMPSTTTTVALPTPSNTLAQVRQTMGISFPRTGDTIAL